MGGCAGTSRLRMPDRHDGRSWLVRWSYGQRYQCYQMPAIDRVTVWRFRGGVAVRHPSLSDALEIATQIKARDTH
jgi:hypothetical protein